MERVVDPLIVKRPLGTLKATRVEKCCLGVLDDIFTSSRMHY